MVNQRITRNRVRSGVQAVVHRHLVNLAARNRPVLLVLETADDQVLGPVGPAGVHRVVVTTRDTLSLPGARRLELDILTRRESLRLLREAVRRQ